MFVALLDDPEQLVGLCFCIGFAELLLHPVVLFVAIANFAILSRAPFLHPNLRFILQCQSACVWLFDLSRCILIVQKFINWNIFFSGSLLLQGMQHGTMMARNYCCHFLIAERIVATLYYRNYEKSKWFCWNIGCFLLLVVFCIFNAYQNIVSGQMWSVTSVNFFSILVGTAFCLLEFVIIIGIGIHSRRKYEKLFPNLQSYNLSEKFQIGENIRTSKQLAIAFMCHFFNNLIGAFVAAMLFYKWIENGKHMSLFLAFTTLLQSLLAGAIEVTVIMLHPTLRKKVVDWLKKGRCKQNRVEENSDNNNNHDGGGTIRRNGPNQQQQKNVLGNPLISPMDANAHLRIIQADW